MKLKENPSGALSRNLLLWCLSWVITALLLLPWPPTMAALADDPPGEVYRQEEQGWSIRVPPGWDRREISDGRDRVTTFVNPAGNVAVRVRVVPMPLDAELTDLIQTFEHQVLVKARRLGLAAETFNERPGVLAAYETLYEGVDVRLVVFFQYGGGNGYITMAIVPVVLWQDLQEQAEGVLGTFALD